MNTKNTLLISSQLREHIKKSHLSQYRIAKNIGVSQAVISRFMTGRSGLSLNTIDKIGAELGLKLNVAKIHPQRHE
jgi:predicted XRE-type DNA-binding protein